MITCLALTEELDQGRFTGGLHLNVPLGQVVAIESCKVLNLKLLDLEPILSVDGHALCRHLIARVEVELLAGARLLFCQQEVILQSQRPLHAAPAATIEACLQPLLTSARTSSRQETRLTLRGQTPGDQFGMSIAFVGDLDGDQISDLAVGAPGATPNGLVGAGRVYLYSGATGRLIRQIDGLLPEGAFGFSVAGVGDVNGDGVPDLLIGAPGPNGSTGQAFVVSGRTGSQLRTFTGTGSGDQFGWSVAGIADVDGDGVGDLLVGAPSADPGGRVDAGSVYLFSGASGLPLGQIDGAVAGDALGFSVSSPGDINGDSTPDLLLGASQASPGGKAQAGQALLVSGRAPFPILQTWSGAAAGDGLGWLVALAGDYDGDGVPDLLVGAPGASPAGRVRAGSLHVFSGATGALLARLDGAAAEDGLGVSAAAIDTNGDDRPELLVGSPDAGPGFSTGQATLFSNPTGMPIRTLRGEGRYNQLGWAVAVDGKNQALAIGAPVANPNNLTAAGAVQLLLLATATLRLGFCLDVDVVVQRPRAMAVSTSGPC